MRVEHYPDSDIYHVVDMSAARYRARKEAIRRKRWYKIKRSIFAYLVFILGLNLMAGAYLRPDLPWSIAAFRVVVGLIVVGIASMMINSLDNRRY